MKDLKPFLLYPNAPIHYDDTEWTLHGIQFDALRQKDYYIKMYRKGVWEMPEVKVEFCKPILRRLSSITEEHKRELAVILGWGDICTIRIDGDYLDVLSPAKRVEDTHDLSELPYKAADYLRENSYDIDGYLESGKAIEQPQ